MLQGLNYEPNVDNVIIVHNNDGMIRCCFYIPPPIPNLRWLIL